MLPFDAAKSRVQVALGTATASPAGTSVVGALVQLWRERAVYRGLTPMLVRAVPVHMVYLPCYTFLMGSFAPGTTAEVALRRHRSTGDIC